MRRIHRVVAITVGLILAAGTASGCGNDSATATAGGESFWMVASGVGDLEAGVERPPLVDLLPSNPTSFEFLEPETVVVGRVVSIDPGIAYASGGDSRHSPIVPFDSDEAVFRWMKLTLRVDEVIDSALPFSAEPVAIEIPMPSVLSIDDVRRSTNPDVRVLAEPAGTRSCQ